MEVGIDIVDIDRFHNMKNTEHFEKLYLDKSEIEYLDTKIDRCSSLAGIFSCKEAVLKAFGIGIGNGIKLCDIIIKHNEFNKPYVFINSYILDLLEKNQCKEIKISISHSTKLATSICIIN